MSNPYEKYLSNEDKVHVAVCNYLRVQYPGCIIHHSPMEGKRTRFEQYKMKMLGASAGFPDLLVFYKEGKLAIELKAGKNKATALQKVWIETLAKYGFETGVCTGFDEARQFIDDKLKPFKYKKFDAGDQYWPVGRTPEETARRQNQIHP